MIFYEQYLLIVILHSVHIFVSTQNVITTNFPSTNFQAITPPSSSPLPSNSYEPSHSSSESPSSPSSQSTFHSSFPSINLLNHSLATASSNGCPNGCPINSYCQDSKCICNENFIGMCLSCFSSLISIFIKFQIELIRNPTKLRFCQSL